MSQMINNHIHMYATPYCSNKKTRSSKNFVYLTFNTGVVVVGLEELFGFLALLSLAMVVSALMGVLVDTQEDGCLEVGVQEGAWFSSQMHPRLLEIFRRVVGHNTHRCILVQNNSFTDVHLYQFNCTRKAHMNCSSEMIDRQC